MTIRAIEAFDAQYDLARWWATDDGMHYAVNWSYSRTGAIQRGLIGEAARPHRVQAELEGPRLANMEKETLLHSTTYFITKDMLTLVEAAAQSMPPQPLKETDLPSPRGFAYFAKGIVFYDIHGDAVVVKAVKWGPGVIGGLGHLYPEGDEPEINRDTATVGVSLYGDKWDERDVGVLRMRESLDETVWGSLNRLMLVDIYPWILDRDYTERELYDEGEGTVYTSQEVDRGIDAAVAQRRFLAALWAIMKQPIVVDEPYAPSRTERRQLQRAGTLDILLEDPIRVITLRKHRPKKDEPDGEGHPIEWSHRWVVSGFWRNQWYPSEGVHRQIWISEYIKGPEDKPLVVKNKIFELKR